MVDSHKKRFKIYVRRANLHEYFSSIFNLYIVKVCLSVNTSSIAKNKYREILIKKYKAVLTLLDLSKVAFYAGFYNAGEQETIPFKAGVFQQCQFFLAKAKNSQ